MQSAKSVFVLLKTQKLKYADSGFIRRSDSKINVELFNASAPVLDLELKKLICINKICYNKTKFNYEFLGYIYYEDILKDIVTFSPIYGRKNFMKVDDGFKQTIVNKNVDILYNVRKDSLVFIDKKRGVKIKIKML